jgi:Lrp/AsnC family transcriptional regulator for asnA, asnC and gidA
VGDTLSRAIDLLDKMLVALLAGDGRRPLAELAARAGVSRPTAATRLRALLGDGVARVSGLIDATSTPGLTVALVGLTLDEYLLDEKVEQLAALDDVSWAAVVTGRYDIIAEVVTEEGMAGLYDFLNTSLRDVGGIESSEMFVVMKARDKWLLPPARMVRSWTGTADR